MEACHDSCDEKGIVAEGGGERETEMGVGNYGQNIPYYH